VLPFGGWHDEAPAGLPRQRIDLAVVAGVVARVLLRPWPRTWRQGDGKAALQFEEPLPEVTICEGLAARGAPQHPIGFGTSVRSLKGPPDRAAPFEIETRCLCLTESEEAEDDQYQNDHEDDPENAHRHLLTPSTRRPPLRLRTAWSSCEETPRLFRFSR
jgi:hypothetical protein